MKEALMGIETEYGIYCDIKRLHRIVDASGNGTYVNFILKQVASLLPENDYLMFCEQTGEFWTRGGMRVYADTGMHLEVATGECANFSELVFQKNVGDCLVQALVDKARETLGAIPYGYTGPLAVYANNTAIDFERPLNECPESEAVFAHHENYLLRRDMLAAAAGTDTTLFDYILANAGYFLAALPILGGAGHITPRGKFVLSPRAVWTVMTTGGNTTSNRALVNTRDESHADSRKFLRYHHIAGDTNITDRIVKMKMAFTYWVLRMIERGWTAPDWLRHEGTRVNEQDLLGLLHDINDDPRLNKTYTICGRNLRAAEILSVYLEAVDEHRQKLLFEAEDDEIFEEVASYLSRARDGFEGLVGESEWATKYSLMLREMSRKNIRSFNDARLKRLSIELHNIDRDPGRNSFFEFRNKVLPPNMEIGDLTKACRRAPRTRAFTRGLAIFLAKHFNVVIRFATGTEWISFSTSNINDSIQYATQSASFSLDRMTPWKIDKDDVKRVVHYFRGAASRTTANKIRPTGESRETIL